MYSPYFRYSPTNNKNDPPYILKPFICKHFFKIKGSVNFIQLKLMNPQCSNFINLSAAEIWVGTGYRHIKILSDIDIERIFVKLEQN